MSAPQQDWVSSRFGADPPLSLAQLSVKRGMSSAPRRDWCFGLLEVGQGSISASGLPPPSTFVHARHRSRDR